MENIFTEQDKKFLQQRNMQPNKVLGQIDNYRKGFPFVELHEAASLKHGITQLSSKKMDDMVSVFEDFASDNEIVKFVPASGAASRMFKNLFEFRNSYRGTYDDQLELLKDKGPDSVYYFFEHIEEFAFFPDLLDAFDKRKLNFENTLKELRYERVLNTLLTEKGLCYGEIPKALIPFHIYPNEVRTAFAEHLAEGAKYARSSGNVCKIHFTVSPQHMEMMHDHFQELKDTYEDRYNIRYEISYSLQDPSTDVITVDMNNNPLRNELGEFVFRPGGHGALLKNLNELKADLIIIKNIDNVCHDRVKYDTHYYKMALCGYLVFLQEQIHSYLKGLKKPTAPSTKVITNMLSFMEHKLNIRPPLESNHWNKEKKIAFIKEKLNRPIRVCGMVENEGEPGGGPFWVENKDGSFGLQIIEASQINSKDENQLEIINRSTHFNPVDLICSTIDFEGKHFNLYDYVNPNTGFISHKSLDGEEIKAQELPGLWNGTMADWITIFVEVPLITFNPVKIINDLLRTQHLNVT